MSSFLLAAEFPELANELRERLAAAEEQPLAEQVATLRVVDRCRCGDDFCATMHTAPQPRLGYGPSHRNVDLDPPDGYLILDVVEERIVSVEVLDRPVVRRRLLELLP